MVRTRCIGLDDIQPDVGILQNGAVQLAIADLSDETQPVKSSHCWRSVCHNGGWTRIIIDTRLFIQIAVHKMAGDIWKRFIYIRKQRRNSGAHGGQCIIKSEH